MWWLRHGKGVGGRVGREKEMQSVELGQQGGERFQGISVGDVSIMGRWRHCMLV